MFFPPEPCFFGSDDRPLFGWFHPKDELKPSTLGLVICNPFGYESSCAHRTMRQTAIEAAAAGIPSLRFDYDGTGDSAGTDSDPHRVRGWLDSIHQAIDALGARSGCSRFIMFGIRLGAALAALAATERADVAALVAFAPIVSGRAYLRELRALQFATGLAPNPADSAITEVTGFVITDETREDLTRLDLLSQERRPAAQVLILDRDDRPGNAAWAEKLTTLGADVKRLDVPGYVEMMLSPHSTIVPVETLQRAIDWMAQLRHPETANNVAASEARALPQLRRSTAVPTGIAEIPSIRESAVGLGPNEDLFAIVSEPNERTPRINTGVVLLNAGSTHHIGPSRLYVPLARSLATRGFTVLRIDLSGLGDSPARAGEAENVVYSGHAASDLRTAIDFLLKHKGVEQCYAVGLCSGAYHALKGAVAGAPLAALIMINPLTFFWHEGMSLDAKMPDQWVIAESQRYQQSAFQLEPWLKLLRGGVDVGNILAILRRRLTTSFRHSARDLARQLRLPLKNDLGRELESVSARGVQLRFVFSDSDPGAELLRIEGGSSVRKLLRSNRLGIRIIEGADHTFTPKSARDQLQMDLATELHRLTGG